MNRYSISIAAPAAVVWRTLVDVERWPPDGGVGVTLTVRHGGPLAPLVGLVTARRTQRYIEIEANGLKKVAESVEPGVVDEPDPAPRGSA